MGKKNQEIADRLERLADALEFLGEIPFKVIAYRKAARVLADLPEDIEEVYRSGGMDALRKIPGIGEGIAKKIVQYLETGRIEKYEEVMAKVPGDLLDLMEVQGIGPKTLKLAYDKLGVKTKEDFKRVLEDGSLEKLPGMGKKKIENIKRGLELFEKMAERIPLGLAYPLVQGIVEALKDHPDVLEISPCGSFRRMKETIGDIDILVAAEPGKGTEIIQAFVHLPDVTQILAAGDTKGSAIFQDRYQVDLRVVPPDSYGAALQYFTGSKAHNVHMRGLARAQGLKVSEYGVFRGDQKIAGKDEEEVYRAVGLVWIPPELREDMGEIEAALEGRLPNLIGYDDLKGDLHVHSRYSDGSASLEEIAKYGIRRGYEYIAVCDHSQGAKYARGLDLERLQKKNQEIDELNRKLQGFTLLKGTEVDILPDGSLDYPDEVLAQLDYVCASIHQWKRNEDATERILRAMENPYVHAIGHPTGRLISTREGYRVDMEAVLKKAAETGTFLEINAYYERLDLNDVHTRRAKELGVKIVIGTDAHQMGQLWLIRLGIGVARRAWLEPRDVINTLPLPQLREALLAKRRKFGVA